MNKRLCVNGVRVLDGDVRMVLLTLGITGREFCSSLDDYYGASNVLKARRPEDFVPRDQSFMLVKSLGLGRSALAVLWISEGRVMSRSRRGLE